MQKCSRVLAPCDRKGGVRERFYILYFMHMNAVRQGSLTFLKLRATSCVPIISKGCKIDTNEIKILLNLPSIILVLIIFNVKTLIMLILFLE